MIKVMFNPAIRVPFTKEYIEKIVRKISKKEKKITGSVEINIVGDKEIKELNSRYRGKNKVTDVLSFAWQEEKSAPSQDFLGQIYICFPRIVRQAKEFKVNVEEEFFRMLAHGLLHLAGYDHEEEKEAKKMFDLQEKILKSLI